MQINDSEMNKNTITFRIIDVITIVIVILFIKFALYYYPNIEPVFDEFAYNILVDDMNIKTVSEMENAGTSSSGDELYYIGRGSCIDCREGISNILILKEYAEETGRKFFYVKLKNEITEEERRYLDSIGVDNIPTITLLKGGKIKQFGFEEIVSSDFKSKFEDFLEEV